MKKIVVLFIVFISTLFVRAQAPTAIATPTIRIDRIDIVEKGLYRVELNQEVDDPNVLSGHRYVHSKGELTKDTTTIPAVSGTQFGFRYTVVGEPKGEKTPTRIIAHYPEGGRQNPKTGKIAFQDEFPQTATIGGPPSFFYFNMKWGMVPGVWTIEVWCQDRKLAEQKFTIAQP